VTVNALLILGKSCRDTIPRNELDGGDKDIRQLGDLDFTDNTALREESETVRNEVDPYRHL